MKKKLTIFGLSIALVFGMILVSLGDIPFILPIDLFLNTILDVNAGTPADKDALIWDSTTAKWIPEARSTMPNSIDLDDLGDVNAGAPNDNDALTWDAGTSKWIPEEVAAGVSESDLAFLDNFDDDSRHWGWYDNAKNGTITESGEVVTLAIGLNVDGDIASNGGNNGPRCLMGDSGAPFEVKTKLNSYTVGDSTQVGICVAIDSGSGTTNEWFFFGRTKKTDQAVDGLATSNPAGGWSQTNAVTTLPIYLRFRITVLSQDEAAICECAYSTDDESYTVLDTFSMSAIGAVFEGYRDNWVVGIFARNKVGGEAVEWKPAISAPFEWFKMCRTLGPG